jgi:hypothetical protein
MKKRVIYDLIARKRADGKVTLYVRRQRKPKAKR